MDSADQITDPLAAADHRAAALRARIRELRKDASTAAPRDMSAKPSDTRPSSTTEVEGSEFADNQLADNQLADGARLTSRTGIGAIPAVPVAPGSAAPRWRWQYPPARLPTESADSAALFRGRATKDLLRLTPVWLISALLHALLLVTLALLTYSQVRLAPAIMIAGNHSDREILPETVDPVEISRPAIEIDNAFWNPDAADPGSLDLQVSNELAAPAFSSGWEDGVVLSEQLSAAQRVAGGGNPRSDSHRTGAQFYGIQAEGNRFVFIVDSSTSMRFKFAEAKRELESAVRRLNQDQLFYVIFFDRDAERMRFGKWNSKGTRYSMKTQPEPHLVAANEENIHALAYWMNTIQLDSDTNPYPAVVYALRKLQPDAIFVLSDGEFNDGGSTEAFLEHENIADDPTAGRSPKTIVHAVGFYSRQGEITLKRIAAANGGSYRFIEPPGGLLPIMNPALSGKRRVR